MGRRAPGAILFKSQPQLYGPAYLFVRIAPISPLLNMTACRRYRVKGGCYFFTVALAERKGQLLIEHIEGLHAALREPA